MILTPTDLLSAEDLVSVFHRDALGVNDNDERFVGLGVVQTMNDDGRPQVAVFHEGRGGDDVWRKVRERDAAYRLEDVR